MCSSGAFKLLLLLSRREIVLESEQYSVKKALCDFWSNVNFPLWFTSIHKENCKENLTVNQAVTTSFLSFPREGISYGTGGDVHHHLIQGCSRVLYRLRVLRINNQYLYSCSFYLAWASVEWRNKENIRKKKEKKEKEKTNHWPHLYLSCKLLNIIRLYV